MSARPILYKRTAQLRKRLRRSPQGFIDLRQWLKDHGYADTTGKANAVILDKRVRVDSHVMGVKERQRLLPSGIWESFDEVDPYIDSKHRKSLTVL